MAHLHHEEKFQEGHPKHDAPHSEPQHDGDHSLTTVLGSDQCSELTFLIASAMVSMRKSIESNFSATSTLSLDLISELTMSEDEKMMNPNIDPGTANVGEFDRERKLKEQREKELSEPKMIELKAAALKFFDGWRGKVIQRVGEVVNSREKVEEQKEEAAHTMDPNTEHRPEDKKINPESHTSRKTDEEAKASALTDLYPPISTPLASLEEEKRELIIHCMLLLVLSLEHYVATSRILLLYLTSSLRLPLVILTRNEEELAKNLLEAAKELTGDEVAQKKVEANKALRKWKVGLATAAGAAVIGITGGMAAPLVAAGVGSVMGGLGLGATAAAGYLGSVAGSTVLVGGLFGAYGGRMTGQMMDNYAREVEDFAFIPVRGERKKFDKKEEEEAEAAKENHLRRLRVAIGISGWLTEKEEVVKPWHVLGKGAEVFALRWELESLMNLGNSMETMLKSAAWGYAQKELIERTIFAELMGAMWPLGLLKVSRVADNPFSVAKSRGEKAGEVLADALINKAQGERPVTLVGYSLGARLIYSCLMSLARRKAFGLVENAVLIGAPIPSDTKDWRVMRSVVSGRLVNVYSENDYVLGFLYRTSSIQYGIAGLQKVGGLPGVENVDVSEAVKGHLRYRFLVGHILKKIGFEDVELEEVTKEEEALKAMDEEEHRKNLLEKAQVEGQIEKFKNMSIRSGKKGEEHDDEEAEKEVQNMEKEVKEKTQESLYQRAAELYTSARGISGATGPSKPDVGALDKDGKVMEQKSLYQRAAESIYSSTSKEPLADKGPHVAQDKGKDAAQGDVNHESLYESAASYSPSLGVGKEKGDGNEEQKNSAL